MGRRTLLTASIAAFVAFALMSWLMRPVECLMLPSDPPQGPFCTSVLGLTASWASALVAGSIAAAIVMLITAFMHRRRTAP